MKSNYSHRFFYCATLFLFISCSSTKPMGPKIAVMPAPGKPFDQFVLEENECRNYAQTYIANNPQSATGHGVGTVLAGTALGGAAGALMGGREGASVGAGVGLIGGSLAGAGQTGIEGRDIQWSYDNAYAQCMYAKGNQVPGFQTQQLVSPPVQKK
ncbi:MAG: hypothetical protein Q7U04_08440 [Bacteriovorax sp.]|nr:hypothetical protein [Bacteriovorax sp.]